MSKESQVIGMIQKVLCLFHNTPSWKTRNQRGKRSSKVFIYVIEDVGSMNVMLENGFHKGDNIKHFWAQLLFWLINWHTQHLCRELSLRKCCRHIWLEITVGNDWHMSVEANTGLQWLASTWIYTNFNERSLLCKCCRLHLRNRNSSFLRKCCRIIWLKRTLWGEWKMRFEEKNGSPVICFHLDLHELQKMESAIQML